MNEGEKKSWEVGGELSYISVHRAFAGGLKKKKTGKAIVVS